MGRILLIAALVVVGLLLIGSIIGLVFSALKWVLIIGAIVLGVMLIMKSTGSRHH
ncbi:hypothetical protein [Microtetraspora sp. NBRC 16547]|uniref:hypothetical protein n=1 Tax=Microtetraspora sp. NBRC 16547 TaxID=3030993 RepID=UPI0024A1EFA6|nr:hypothetical protein [Microtetraspora sp. NBRC 16547]GLW98738.1 hypothetical protein Misp02_28250 [Microtetraspora sp. NBRC 16547]